MSWAFSNARLPGERKKKVSHITDEGLIISRSDPTIVVKVLVGIELSASYRWRISCFR